MILRFARPDLSFRPGIFSLPRTVNLTIGSAPEFLHSKRVLFLSDVHLRPRVSDAQLCALIEQLRAQQADLILLGGDYAESDADCARFFRALEAVPAPLGKFAIRGNNDRMNRAALKEIAARAGITLLFNACEQISLPDGILQIGGCDDHKIGTPNTEFLFPTAENAYRILLSHWPIQPNCACDLMLSGHTHAGQLNLLGITPYFVGFECRHHLLGVRGLKRIDAMRLLISNGIGISRIPLRIGAEPQIYLLKFSHEDFC